MRSFRGILASVAIWGVLVSAATAQNQQQAMDALTHAKQREGTATAGLNTVSNLWLAQTIRAVDLQDDVTALPAGPLKTQAQDRLDEGNEDLDECEAWMIAVAVVKGQGSGFVVDAENAYDAGNWALCVNKSLAAVDKFTAAEVGIASANDEVASADSWFDIVDALLQN